MKITRYMGAFAVIAMLAACSTDDEQGTNTAANEVKITANVGGNSIFTRSNPLGTEAEQQSFNENDVISVTTEGKTVIYKKTGEVWAPANAGDYLVWTGNAQAFEAFYPEKADESTTNSFSVGYVSADQSTVDKIEKSDYMISREAIEKAYIPSDRQLTLNFARQTARVIVKVSGFGDEFKDLNPTLSAVEVYSKLKVPAGESDSYAAIKTYKKEESGSNVFYALVSPGDANSTEKFLKLTVTYNDGEVVNPTQTKELYVTGIPALDKAMSYTYDVKIGKDKATIGSVSVTDWSPGDDITGGDAVTTTENAVLIIKNALAVGNTNIVINNLAANADISVFNAIKEALSSASDGSIDLTVYGVEALPSSAFSDCQPLKVISLQNVKSIDWYAFRECNGLETIYAPIVSSISDYAFFNCRMLKSVTLGNISAAGFRIFEGVPTENVDLILSKDQKVMTGRDYEGWKSDESEKYANSPDHKQRQFLGKTFKSIKCGRNTY
ncbi:fimbrillin family protein [Segatella copri]|uniref:fimbrillin family protein n=1 Tax=Segatella copri TaxID=165179 RepID=UPI002232BB67|nr:leucine-rich repeat protein [Segatella copri]MCW4082091.1 leucine-rich repeat protein [Segatella copri]